MITRMSVLKAEILITLIANHRYHFFLLAAFESASVSKYLNKDIDNKFSCYLDAFK